MLNVRIVALQRRVFTRFQEIIEGIAFWLSLQHDKLSLHNDSISENRYNIVVTA